MDYPPPSGQSPNDPNPPDSAPDYGRPPNAPDGPTITQGDYTGYAPPPPPMPPPQQYGGYAPPPPTGPTASFSGYPRPPAPSGPMPPYGGYAPPAPAYAPPPYAGPPSQARYGQQPVIYQPVIYQPQPARGGGAVAVEVIAGLFGIWGVGWMMSGYTSVGVTLLLVGLLAMPGLAIALIVLTFGFGVVLLPCFGVADIAVIVISAVNLSNRLKSGPPPLL